MKEIINLKMIPSVTDEALVFVETKMEQIAASPKLQNTFLIATDELVSNILNHSTATDLEIIFEAHEHNVSLTLIDNGEAFNPLNEKGNSENKEDVGDRPIGGLGISIVRKTMDNCEYTFENEKNMFKLVKNKG